MEINSKYELYEFNTCLINTTSLLIDFFFNNILYYSNILKLYQLIIKKKYL